jgi:hypothetical protein
VVDHPHLGRPDPPRPVAGDLALDEVERMPAGGLAPVDVREGQAAGDHERLGHDAVVAFVDPDRERKPALDGLVQSHDPPKDVASVGDDIRRRNEFARQANPAAPPRPDSPFPPASFLCVLRASV